MKRATPAEKAERLAHVNALIKTISDHGRRFFYNERNNRVAEMIILQRGQLYFVDDYSNKPIYVAYQGHWRGFSHGGTMKQLIGKFAYYINTGEKIGIFWIGPERLNITDGNIWGYAPDEMAKCRAEALLNPAVKAQDDAAEA